MVDEEHFDEEGNYDGFSVEKDGLTEHYDREGNYDGFSVEE